MILVFDNVLNADELAEVTGALREDDFEDGKATAGWHARLVKNNAQLKTSDEERVANVRHTINKAIERHSEFVRAFRPKLVRPSLVSRYTDGMSYGRHVDDPFMIGKPPIRTGLALTLFLVEPDTYDGGELVADSTFGRRTFKLPAGSMVAYPATTLHEVMPVTRGVRLCAVTWGQSLIRDPALREMIYDLDNARREMFERDGKTRSFDLASKTHANLLRLWAEL